MRPLAKLVMLSLLLFSLSSAVAARSAAPVASAECVPPSDCSDPDGYCECITSGHSHIFCWRAVC